MTIAKDFASKFAVAIVAVAMILMAVPSAQAASHTSQDLQKTINDLLAQVAALQTEMGGTTTTTTTTTTTSSCSTFAMDLKMGSTNADVKALQMFLNSDADTMVSMTGAGSKGMETMYFGPATAAAVSKFQVKYRAEVLTPAGLVNPTGFFGPGSRAQANKLCAGGPTTPTEPTTPGTPSTGDLSGEASLIDFTIDSASDDTVEEGAEDVEIAEVTVKFEDGDASISRLDVTIDDQDESTDPWDVLDTVTIMVDGDDVGSVDASDEDNYLNETNGTIRISGLDIVAMEDEDVDITIAATFQDGIDTPDLDVYDVSVVALRYFDADGVATTDDDVDEMGDTVSFTLEEAGADDEIVAKTSSEDPDSTTLQVEDDQKSDWYTVFAFDLDTKDSVNDLTLNTVVVNVTTNGVTATDAGYSDLVDDAELIIDGTTIDDVTVGGVSTTEGLATLTFDVDGDVEINAGDRVTAELRLKFKSLLVTEEGATVQGSISSLTTTIVDAEGAEDLENGQLSGAATGDVHTLRTTGIITEVTDDSADVTKGDSADDDYATFELKVDVTAFEQDAYIPTTGATVDADILDNTNAVLAGSPTVVLSSTGKTVNNRFEITEGSTETLTVKVTYDPTATPNVNAKMVLNSIGFYETSAGVTLKTQTTLPAEDYDTETVTIVN